MSLLAGTLVLRLVIGIQRWDKGFEAGIWALKQKIVLKDQIWAPGLDFVLEAGI